MVGKAFNIVIEEIYKNSPDRLEGTEHEVSNNKTKSTVHKGKKKKSAYKMNDRARANDFCLSSSLAIFRQSKYIGPLANVAAPTNKPAMDILVSNFINSFIY